MLWCSGFANIFPFGEPLKASVTKLVSEYGIYLFLVILLSKTAAVALVRRDLLKIENSEIFLQNEKIRHKLIVNRADLSLSNYISLFKPT